MSKSNSLRALCSLRFFAAVLVVLAHFRYTFWPANIFGPFDDFAPIVSFFFMLSGFTLTYSGSSSLSVHPLSFLLKRIGRIWPSHVLMVILIFLLLPGNVAQNMALSHPWEILTANILLIHAWVPVQDYFFAYNTPSWYLSTQLAMYLLFPWLIRNFNKNWPYKLALCLLSVLACLGLASSLELFNPHQISGQGLLYISPLCRLLEFVVGMTGGLVFTPLSSKYTRNYALGTLLECLALLIAIGAMAMVQPLSAGFNNVPFLGKELGFYVGFAGITLIPFFVLIQVFALERGALSRMLSLPLFYRLGTVSFSVYLLHIPLLQYYLYPIALKPNIPIPSTERILTYWGILLLAAFITERFFEKPVYQGFSALTRKITRKQTLDNTPNQPTPMYNPHVKADLS